MSVRAVRPHALPAVRRRSSDRLDSAFSEEAVTYPEHVRNLDPAVEHAMEDAERLEVLAHAGGAAVDLRRGQFHLIVCRLALQAGNNVLLPPAFFDVAERARHAEAPERFERPMHPRIVFSDLADPYAGRLA